MLFLLPTDTCYGLAGAFTQEDYEGIYALKGRDFTKQLTLLVKDYVDMKDYIEISDRQIEFLTNYPHSWSFLGKRKSTFHLPKFMDPEKYENLSLRVGLNCINANIRDNIVYPLFLTSANLSGQSESITFEQTQKIFPGIGGIDGGVCNKPPSDIFSIGEGGELRYLRRNYGI